MAVRQFHVKIWKEGKFFVALCEELDVASQGLSLEEALYNIREAVELHIEEEIAPPVRVDFSVSLHVPYIEEAGARACLHEQTAGPVIH